MKTLKKNICESCGMLMKSMTDFGTDSDGSINTDFCHFCLDEGEFTDKGISFEEKIARNIDMAVKFGMSKVKASNLVKNTLPKLRRMRKSTKSKKVKNNAE
ncbi:zinc ribbon domain-containing protein [uncultured Eudoraea sp.]|uniref:zinc ribbon domain-containing protein n=1 Tax=uncultured Eudoraea sp. TaxID=1035614 RepID=UPI002607625A|nr:zinc ribbon domain-containing protein [uncultured Eudoraea sp.]